MVGLDIVLSFNWVVRAVTYLQAYDAFRLEQKPRFCMFELCFMGLRGSKWSFDICAISSPWLRRAVCRAASEPVLSLTDCYAPCAPVALWLADLAPRCGRCAPRPCPAMACSRSSSPDGCTVIPRATTRSLGPPSSAALRPYGCG